MKPGKDPERAAKWFRASGRDDLEEKVLKYFYVCSEHFIADPKKYPHLDPLPAGTTPDKVTNPIGPDPEPTINIKNHQCELCPYATWKKATLKHHVRVRHKKIKQEVPDALTIVNESFEPTLVLTLPQDENIQDCSSSGGVKTYLQRKRPKVMPKNKSIIDESHLDRLLDHYTKFGSDQSKLRYENMLLKKTIEDILKNGGIKSTIVPSHQVFSNFLGPSEGQIDEC